MTKPATSPHAPRGLQAVRGLLPPARWLLLSAGLALVPTLAAAQGTPEQQEACTPDAVRLCSASIPDIPKTTACMKAHVAQLSPRCRAAFNDVIAPKAAEAKTASKAAPTKAARAPVKSAKSEMAERRERRSSRAVLASRQDERQDERQVERRGSRAEAPMANRSPRGEASESTVIIERRAPPPLVAVAPAPVIRAPGFDGTRVTLSTLCRNGLIDAFTCANTVPSLGLGE